MCFTKMISLFGAVNQEIEGVFAEVHDMGAGLWREVVGMVLSGGHGRKM